jgi:hypothetical protein
MDSFLSDSNLSPNRPSPKVFQKTLAFSSQVHLSKSEDVWVCFLSCGLPEYEESFIRKLVGPAFHVSVKDYSLLRRKWGARELPWFLVTDSRHLVVYEGPSEEDALAAVRQKCLPMSDGRPPDSGG